MDPNFSSIITRLDAHILESDRRHNETAEILKNYKIMIDSKVSYKQYTWTLGIMILILMAMFAYIAARMDDLARETASMGNNISYIQGVFKNYDLKVNN